MFISQTPPPVIFINQIRALSMALERTIEVVQIGAPSLFIGESAFANAPTLIIT
jgi:hypothetical protein